MGGVILTPKRSLKNSFSEEKITSDIEELKQPQKRSYPVPKIFAPLSELKLLQKRVKTTHVRSKNNPSYFNSRLGVKRTLSGVKNDPKFGGKL